MRHHHPDDEAGWRAPGCDAEGSPVVSTLLERLDATLADLTQLPLAGLPRRDVARLLEELTSAAGRLTAATGRVAVAADRRRLADDDGARNTPSWWAHRTRITRGEAGRLLGLAERVDTDLHAPVGAALADGRVHADQAGVIVESVDALPDRIGPDLRGQARDHLLAAAEKHDARALRVLGRRILDVIAPEIGESEEQKRLEAEESAALARARITFTDDGHGRCHGRFTLPSHIAALLKEQLHAIANPRRHPLGDVPDDQAERGGGMPGPVITPERLGQAFIDYIENYPSEALPRRGGGGFDVTVVVDLDTMLSGIGAATLATGGRISVGEARRLACQAGIVPVVLDGESQPLDVGRSKRLFTAAQRRALELRDGGCSTDGCGLPAAVCDAHHDQPWSEHGGTDLGNGRLLCPRHHRLAHDRRYETVHLRDHRIGFRRRRCGPPA